MRHDRDAMICATIAGLTVFEIILDHADCAIVRGAAFSKGLALALVGKELPVRRCTRQPRRPKRVSERDQVGVFPR